MQIEIGLQIKSSAILRYLDKYIKMLYNNITLFLFICNEIS